MPDRSVSPRSGKPSFDAKVPSMTTKAGVWIDHKQAIVVLVTNAGNEIKTIAFDIGQPTGRAKSNRSYTPRDFVAEDKRERKVENDLKDYFNDVITALRGATAVWIVGPGEAKGELRKHIIAKKIRGLVVELETTDKMTDRQLVAKVGAHFSEVRAGKSGGSKKKAKAVPGKRRKKTGK